MTYRDVAQKLAALGHLPSRAILPLFEFASNEGVTKNELTPDSAYEGYLTPLQCLVSGAR